MSKIDSSIYRLIGTKIHLYEHHDHELNSLHLFDLYFELNFVLGLYQYFISHNLNNTLHKVTKLGFVVDKVHVRNGLPTLKKSLL